MGLVKFVIHARKFLNVIVIEVFKIIFIPWRQNKVFSNGQKRKYDFKYS